MLDNISLIAAIISAITAFTTSLRALGKSRENLRSDRSSAVTTGCRLSNFRKDISGKHSSLLIHAVSSVIWLGLAVAFSIPPYLQRTNTIISTESAYFLIPFFLLIIFIGFIWWKTLTTKKIG